MYTRYRQKRNVTVSDILGIWTFTDEMSKISFTISWGQFEVVTKQYVVIYLPRSPISFHIQKWFTHILCYSLRFPSSLYSYVLSCLRVSPSTLRPPLHWFSYSSTPLPSPSLYSPSSCRGLLFHIISLTQTLNFNKSVIDTSVQNKTSTSHKYDINHFPSHDKQSCYR